VFENSASARLVGIFSTIKAIFRRNTSVFQGKLTQSVGKGAIKMVGGGFSNTPQILAALRRSFCRQSARQSLEKQQAFLWLFRTN